MNLSIVIVSWNTKELLKKCLDSIYNNQADLSLEIIVVDNNSADGTAKMVEDDFPKTKLMANDKNVGFAMANNQGLIMVHGQYVLFLNPDTEILDNGLKRAVEFMKAHPNCGALGPKLLFKDKSLQASVRRFPTFWPIFLMLIKAPRIFKNLKSLNHYLYKDFDYNKLQEVDQIMGAYMMVPRDIFSKVGFFDHRFFIWFEEVDFCLRIKRAGLKVIYNPQIEVIHHGGASFAQEGLVKKQWQFFKSALRYFLKNGFFSN